MVPEPHAYRRRTLSIVGLFVALFSLLVRLPRFLAVHMSPRRIRPILRETLWLAVTEVNGCRFCAYVHEGMAAASGLSPEEIRLLAAGEAEGLPGLDEAETLAVAYARAWADTNRAPPKGLVDQLAGSLTPAQVADLHALLVTVDFANRAGNTADSLLHRLRHPKQLLQLWPAFNDLVVGTLVALFGWPALVAGALAHWRARPKRPRPS